MAASFFFFGAACCMSGAGQDVWLAWLVWRKGCRVIHLECQGL